MLILTHLIITILLRSSDYYCSHFMDKETWAPEKLNNFAKVIQLERKSLRNAKIQK